ncbi:hypothetical protein TD95_000117 [Thielaviopsis punctulata]|uniref:BTB domain-containing protein n=1 Tax=Thielaviopsis punctulata TaxID=72032 RepID=A0A0F4Z990_9PEZI|nr:hypothetical protein TD95_000117 [Thielaviopsis punctulata]
MAATADISNKQIAQLQRTLLDIAHNNNKLRKLPREDRMAGTPLDNSPEFESLLEACRRGDLKTCHELIISGVNINGRDRYDYTPLILASICGHFELVKLLLDYGALAERNTFQGERCIYGALTLQIRNLLLSYDFSKATDPLREWSGHVNSLRDGEGANAPDFTLNIGGTAESVSIEVHRFVLAARSPFFRDMLAKEPALRSWTLKEEHVKDSVAKAEISHSLPADAPSRAESLHIVQRFLYFDQIPDNFLRDPELVSGCHVLAVAFELPGLTAILDVGDQPNSARKMHQDQVNHAQMQFNKFFAQHIMANKFVVAEEDLDSLQWTYENPAMADVLVRVMVLEEEEKKEQQDDSDEEDLEGVFPEEAKGTVDTETEAQEETADQEEAPCKWVLYPAHKAILTRSTYFKTLFASPFAETRTGSILPILRLECAPVTLEVILANLYFEKGEISLPYSLDLLYAADALFLDKLVNKAALTISSQGMANSNVWVDRTHCHVPRQSAHQQARKKGGDEGTMGIDIYEIIHAAWDLRVHRLEEFAARFFASRLEDYIDEPEFAAIIKESAGRVKNRQATDTIELLDDIRHYIEDRFRMRFQDLSLVMARDPLQRQRIEAEEKQAKKRKTAIQTLSGEMAEDEFTADDMNYNFLLNKIDALLERLNLDA